MTNATQNLSTPQSKLARACERAQHVFQAHRGKDASLDARGATMLPLVERFKAARAAHRDNQAHAVLKRQQRNEAVRVLQQGKRRWLPSLQRDLPGFDTTGFTESDVPEDAVASSRELRSSIEGRIRDAGSLSYAEALTTSLIAAETQVEAAARAVYEADTRAQQASTDHQEAARQLDRELIAFRAVVRTVLGDKHSDYRKLRARATRDDLDDAQEPDPTVDVQPPNPSVVVNAPPRADATNGHA